MGVIIKRDGRKTEFKSEKIRSAMIAAFNECYKGEAGYSDKLFQFNTLCADVENHIEEICKVTDCAVEEIQDYVVNRLNESYPTVGSAYQRYREKRTAIREKNGVKKTLMDKMKDIFQTEEGEQLNANIDDRVWSAKTKAVSDTFIREYANEHRSEYITNNHKDMRVYIHDSDSWSGDVGIHNCLQLDLKDILMNGLITKQVDIAPARSVSTACQQTALAFQLQSLNQYGGVAAMIDFAYEPFVRLSFYKHFVKGLKFVENLEIDFVKDDDWIFNHSINDKEYLNHYSAHKYAMTMLKDEVNQGIQSLWHNCSSLASRSGNQLPFSSVSLGLCTSAEGRMIIESSLDLVYEGYGPLKKTFVFPCFIFELSKDINLYEGTPNYDLFKKALKCTAKRLYPNYANCDAPMQKKWHELDRKNRQQVLDNLSDSDKQTLITNLKKHPKWKETLRLDLSNGIHVIDEEDYREVYQTMGCRTATSYDINSVDSWIRNIRGVINEDFDDVYDGIWSGLMKVKRGNCNPSTIVLPMLAMEANGEVGNKDINHFMSILYDALNKCVDALVERYESICSCPPSIAGFQYENNTIGGFIPEKGIKSAMRHMTHAVGQVGLYETLKILIGKGHDTEEGMTLAKSIEELYTTVCENAKRKYNLNVGCYYTPSESLAGKSMEVFKEKYGEIPEITNHEYFTNSIHVPVWIDVNPFEKCDIESQLSNYGVAGNIFYVEANESLQHNIDAAETIVLYAMEHGVPYMGINVPLDKCCDCGYGDGEFDVCPMCNGDNIQHLKRQTGYLTVDTRYSNKWKKAEFKDRVKHWKEISV